MNSPSPTVNSVIDLIREASISRLKTLSGRQQVTLTEAPTNTLVFAHWMSFILVSGENLRVIFKAHFMTEAAESLSKSSTLSQALDFFREYCNLTAGQVKLDLDKSKVKVGASLPGLIRGFDEIFYQQQRGAVKSSWLLKCDDAEFVCSAHIEIFDEFEIEKTSPSENSDTGDVEFL